MIRRILPIFLLCLLWGSCSEKKSDQSNRYFDFSIATVLPGQPNSIFDALTGDISPWWDHTFSDNPSKLYIEPKPGGGFYEIFDKEGNGVRHAVVTASQRGKLLRFEGPLGLAGKALLMVSTYELEPVQTDSTRLTVTVHGAGEFDTSLPPIIQNVWKHFIFDRFKPFVESGFLTKKGKK